GPGESNTAHESSSLSQPNASSDPQAANEPNTSGPVAHAEADRLLWDGMEAFTRGNFRQAVTLFERSYALQPTTAMLFTLARAYASVGDCPAARLHLQRYVDEEPEPPAGFYAGKLAWEEDCPAAYPA